MGTKTASTAKKVHVHGGKTLSRLMAAQTTKIRIVDAQSKRSDYDPASNIIPARPTPGKKPSDFFGIWRKTRPELFK